MTPPIDLVEYGQTTHALPDAAGHALDGGKIVKASRASRQPGHWRLSASNKVGAVTVEVPDAEPITVRIQPKLPIARLFFLLGYSLDPLKAWQDGQVDVAEHPDLLPAFAHAVERQINRALQQGLLQGYRATEETALIVRGRVRESEQMRRHFGGTLPVEVAYDEFTTDIPENRILRASVERLLRLPGVPGEVRNRLLHQRARLADATPLVRGQPRPLWQPSRLNARYHQALHLARAVLDEASAEHAPGELPIDGFLFDMNKLFEDFVTVALQQSLRGTAFRGRLQESHYLDEASAIRMKPDFVLYGPDGAPVAVADAKYKVQKKRGSYPDADLYQMLAYCTALGLREGHLIYAKGNESRASHKVRHAGIVLHQHALDLDQSPRELLADISSMTEQMSTAPCV